MRIYGDANTPYEKLKEVDKTLKESCLNTGTTFAQLDQIDYKYSDNGWAKIMRQQKHKAFEEILDIRE